MELSSLSDSDLLERVRAGDAAALETLLSRHYKLVFGVAYRFTASQADAEDITQEVLVRVARSIRGFEGKSKFTTWLYRITANAACDWGKRKARESKVRTAASEEHELNQGVNISQDLSKAIEAALVKLSDKEREAVILTIYEGLTHAEAAEAAGCAETTISWRVFTAKRKLKRLLRA